MYANVDVKSVIVIAGVCRHIWRCPPVHGRQNDQKVPTVQSTWYAIAIEQVTRSNSCDYYSPHFVFCCALCLRCSVHAPSAAVRPANFVTHTHTQLSHTRTHDSITWHRRYFCVASVALMGPSGRRGTGWHRRHFCLAGVAFGATDFTLCGRHGSWWHGRPFWVADVALGDIDGVFAWQARHLWHWAGFGGALFHKTLPSGSEGALYTQLFHPKHFHIKLSHAILSHTNVNTQHFHAHSIVTHTHNSFTYNTFTCNSFTQDSVAHNSFRLFHKQLLCI